METSYLVLNGQQYLLDENGGWVSVIGYTEIFGIRNVNIILNWIVRGIIPASHVITIPELNNMKLIRAVPYAPRAYHRKERLP